MFRPPGLFPFLPGRPRLRLGPPSLRAAGATSGGSGADTGGTTTGPVRPTYPPVLERDPRAPERSRRGSEKLSSIVNSLLRSGQLTQTGVADWSIDPSGSGATFGVTADGRVPGHYSV